MPDQLKEVVWTTSQCNVQNVILRKQGRFLDKMDTLELHVKNILHSIRYIDRH